MQRDAGSSREPRSRSTMSQHVPMSPRARTAADIIIVYSIRPWESRRHCASPPLAVANTFLGEGLCALCGPSAWYARAEWRVSRLPDPTPIDSCDRVRTLLGAKPIAQLVNDASTTDDRASSSEDFGERRANANDASGARHHNLVSKRLEIAGGRGRETRT